MQPKAMMGHRLALLAAAGFMLTGAVTGCGEQSVIDNASDPRPQGVGKAQATKADQWNSANDPERFHADLTYELAALPKAGRAEHIPWPSTYWPTYEDSINVRWAGRSTLSPAEKYDKAFNGWEPADGFMDLKPYESSNCKDKGWDQAYYDGLGPAAAWVSNNKGNKHARDGIDNDGDGETDECDDRDGVETWWGICHAWTPAALLEEEPRRAVEYNGITFEVSDLKALLIMQYDRSHSYMIGGRCNDKEVKRDEHGRIEDSKCRDTNAGTWHVVMANFLGVMKRPLAEDRTYDYEVWNQPVLEWKVNSMEEVDEKAAMAVLDVPEDTEHYPYNDQAVKWFKVNATSYYITESSPTTVPYTDTISSYTQSDTYNYILEIDRDGKINGGEWIGSSRQDHPDFLWLPTAMGGGNPHIDTAQVRMLIEKSLTPEGSDDALTGEVKSYENTFVFDIPDNSEAGVSSTIGVTDELTVGRLQVTVDIEHPFVGDLKVVLRKDGKEAVLHDNSGGSADNIKRSFTVKDMAGMSAAGNWELVVVDNASGDIGKIKTWKLSIFADEGGTPTEEGSFVAKSEGAVALIDNGEVFSSVAVDGAKTIKGMGVTVNISHTYVGALTVALKHGPITEVLHNREGGSATEIAKTYDVTTFNGDLTEGTWELHVTDEDAYDDQGTIESWSVEFTY